MKNRQMKMGQPRLNGDEQICKQLQRSVKNGQISCKQCFETARRCDASLNTIGRLCNEYKIKIKACQLGCFK